MKLNFNENFNNAIFMFVPKRLHFSDSYNVLVLMACGLYNDSHFYSKLLIKLNLDQFIPELCMQVIDYKAIR